MIFNVNNLLFLYIFICVTLILFNSAYMLLSNYNKKKKKRHTNWWKKSIEKQIKVLESGDSIEVKHSKLLEKRLLNSEQFITYVLALDELRENGIDTEKYIFGNYKSIVILANKYKGMEVYEKAFFAYFISKNPPCDGSEYNSLIEILLTFIDGSNMYCRENVLKALYRIGNLQSIENAFLLMNEHNHFHHNKLLSDGLMTFTGDKEALARNLFGYFNKWDENILISVIKFITKSSDKFKDEFISLLNEGNLKIEVQLAIIRYFRDNIHEPARQILIEYLKDNDISDDNIRIVAASVLEKYPGEDAVLALKEALKDHNWYIRYNAASSLIRLNVSSKIIKEIFNDDDLYAKEIIAYMERLERENK